MSKEVKAEALIIVYELGHDPEYLCPCCLQAVKRNIIKCPYCNKPIQEKK